MTSLSAEVDLQKSFRNIMGRFATGVALVTAKDSGQDHGMVVNSLTSVSLDPTLLLFCPARTSSTWPHIANAGSFCISFLAASQYEICRQFASKGVDRFAGIELSTSTFGHPTPTGSLGWIDCAIESTYPAGDHYIVVAKAEAWESVGITSEPLIFYTGRYSEGLKV